MFSCVCVCVCVCVCDCCMCDCCVLHVGVMWYVRCMCVGCSVRVHVHEDVYVHASKDIAIH